MQQWRFIFLKGLRLNYLLTVIFRTSIYQKLVHSNVSRFADMTDEVNRLRPPRFFQPDGIVRSYCYREAEGNQILQVSSVLLWQMAPHFSLKEFPRTARISTDSVFWWQNQVLLWTRTVMFWDLPLAWLSCFLRQFLMVYFNLKLLCVNET